MTERDAIVLFILGLTSITFLGALILGMSWDREERYRHDVGLVIGGIVFGIGMLMLTILSTAYINYILQHF